ncbi:unnamed protein product [Lactuca saligna]|uniref:Uncharacterized protein n=1 Tax=Lactuca saligna TaxID=75948 RepID=A0AA35YH67_LACSI|nr:unnamed protein product [Lactuca saligna]
MMTRVRLWSCDGHRRLLTKDVRDAQRHRIYTHPQASALSFKSTLQQEARSSDGTGDGVVTSGVQRGWFLAGVCRRVAMCSSQVSPVFVRSGSPSRLHRPRKPIELTEQILPSYQKRPLRALSITQFCANSPDSKLGDEP